MRNIFLFFCFFYSLHSVAQNGLHRIDETDLQLLQKIAVTRSTEQTAVLRVVSDANNYVNISIPVGLFAAGVINNDKDMRQNAIYIASSAATTALFNLAIKQLFKRRRPFVAHVTFTAVYQPGGYSFPSGHTSLSFATATALGRAYPKWYIIAPAFLWAGTVGYSRMYFGVHNPSDVAAGALLGIGTAQGLSFIRP